MFELLCYNFAETKCGNAKTAEKIQSKKLKVIQEKIIEAEFQHRKLADHNFQLTSQTERMVWQYCREIMKGAGCTIHSLKIWRYALRLVNYIRYWPCGCHVFSEIQLWPWSVGSAQASKCDVRSSAQRIQWNPLNGTPGVCLYPW